MEITRGGMVLVGMEIILVIINPTMFIGQDHPPMHTHMVQYF
jgi:hypothetical protein